jgi:phage repressor protein C with HTH and peptisase S24 domain
MVASTGIAGGSNLLSNGPLVTVSVIGDSLTPTYNDGDLILVYTDSDPPKSDAVYAIQHSGCLWVKRLHFHFDGSIAVISDNPRYPEQSITGEALEGLQIVGRVMWRGGRWIAVKVFSKYGRGRATRMNNYRSTL